jgi:hypothetical protein
MKSEEENMFWTCPSIAIKNDILYSTENFLKWKHSWELSNRDLGKLTRNIQTFYSAFLYNQSLDAHPLIQHILHVTIDEINWERVGEIIEKKFIEEGKFF